MSVRYLTLEESLLAVRAVHGGDPLPYVSDTLLLQSALERPAATQLGRDANTDINYNGAAMLHSLVRNHALLDGNKRTGWILCVLFFALNGHGERYEEDAMFDFILAVAAGEIEDIGEIARRLAGWFPPRA